MNPSQLTVIAQRPVPVRVLEHALVLANRLGPDLKPHMLSQLALSQGGGILLAQAIELRLALLGLLLNVDPDINAITQRLSPSQIANVLAAYTIAIRDNRVDFDADTLAADLKRAAEAT